MKSGSEFGRGERLALIGLAVVAIVATVAGWHQFWFLTDDAHIAFRYVSNSALGYGYVWNPPPFRPVEGYSSFLWVVLLDVVWRLFGVEPPDSANLIALGFSFLTLLLGAMLFLKIDLGPSLRSWRVPLLALVGTAVLSNRTFLAWTSSGLETAAFNAFVMLWVFAVMRRPFGDRKWVLWVATAGALAGLTRPDGLLLVAVSTALVGLAIFRSTRSPGPRRGWPWRHFATAAPLIAIPAHLLWRRRFYGEWLPNTYYAKTFPGQAFTASGLRYAASFVLEYAVWMWLAALVALLAVRVSQSHWRRLLLLDVGLATTLGQPEARPSPVRPHMPLGVLLLGGILAGAILWAAGRPAAAVLLAGISAGVLVTQGVLGLSPLHAATVAPLAAHFLYYTLVIGGDHFEFRVYSHLVPLLFISFVWLMGAMAAGRRTAAALLAVFVILSWPIPWTHWAITHSLDSRQETSFLKASVAEAAGSALPWLPSPFIAPLRAYDDLQFWLISHAVGMRHQEHKIFYRDLMSNIPPRSEGLKLGGEQYPVVASNLVGVLAWNLPHVAVIDGFGLNDWVIARNATTATGALMAHDRRPPAGYVQCFEPNVAAWQRQTVIRPRSPELTRERIIACEERFAAEVMKRPGT